MDQAYQQLKDALLNGDYKAGERLAVEPVAKAIGASRQPVMDAFRRLAGEGLLTIIPQVACGGRSLPDQWLVAIVGADPEPDQTLGPIPRPPKTTNGPPRGGPLHASLSAQ